MESMLAAASVIEKSWWRRPPGLLSRVLQPFSWLYRLLAYLDRRLNQPHRSPDRDGSAPAPPVIVVGNWVVGGAGKTPTTLALLAHLRASGWTPGVVSRGHGRRSHAPRLVDPAQHGADDVGDEPLLMALRARVPACVARDRCQALDQLLQAHPEVDIIVADDGLQHHRLYRDLEIIVADERGDGNGLCLPAGPLRQPIPARVPEQALLLYTGGVASLPLPGHIARRRLTGVVAFEAWQQGSLPEPSGGWEALQGRRVHAVAGIAAPDRFFDQLRAQGLDLQAVALPDHDPMHSRPWPHDATDVVMTEKDAVKASRWVGGRTRLWVARLDLQPEPSFWSALDRRLAALRA